VIDKDRPDYTVYCDAAASMKLAEALRWFWSMTVNGSMTRSGRVATLEEAEAQFQKSWDAWKACAKTGGGARRIVINFWDDNSGS